MENDKYWVKPMKTSNTLQLQLHNRSKVFVLVDLLVVLCLGLTLNFMTYFQSVIQLFNFCSEEGMLSLPVASGPCVQTVVRGSLKSLVQVGTETPYPCCRWTVNLMVWFPSSACRRHTFLGTACFYFELSYKKCFSSTA